MKKLVALLLGAIMVLSLVACGGKEESKSDLDYVKKNGKLIVGITEYAPMDYKDEKGNWIGFDAEMATAFAEYLGVDVEFFVITDWGQKAMELDTKSIDCVWNGMTLTDEVKALMDCSNAYCKNQQVVVVKADKADQYATKESLKDLTFAVEDGSAGEDQADANEWAKTEVENQAATLQEVKAGASGAAIIDLLMAGAMIGEGTDYAELKATVSLSEEEFGVGFRKGSDLVEELNKFLKEAYADGSMMKCAEKYGVQKTIIEQK